MTWWPFAMRHPRNWESPYSEFFVEEVDYHARHSVTEIASAAARILYSRHAGRQLRALLESGRPDIAHLHNIYHQLSPAILPVLAESGRADDHDAA